MTPPLDTPIVTPDHDIYEAYDKVRKLIPEEPRESFDDDMEEMFDEEADDEAENYFDENIIKYLDDHSPSGYFFGDKTGESGMIGFWKIKDIEKDIEKQKEEKHEIPPTGLAEVLDEQGKTIATSPYWVSNTGEP